MGTVKRLLVAGTLALSLLTPANPLGAQEVEIKAAPATSDQPSEERSKKRGDRARRKAMKEAMKARANQAKADAKDPKKDKPDAKKDEAKGEKKSDAAKTVARPDKPSEPPDPNELKAQPDTEGMVRFNFRGQPWQGVLEWLAETSGLSLYWEEVPSGYLDLITQRRYTLREARDKINGLLLMKGFTLLQSGDVLTVVNLAKLNPSIVPRVSPDQLAGRDPHEFVKVSFPLDWLMATTAAEELKHMLSPHHKIIPLKATNRIEVMDAVINLREIQRLLREEQSTSGRDLLVREFDCRWTRATEVVAQLKELLGVESKGPKVPLTPQQVQQMQQAAQQRQQQQKKKGGTPAKPKVEIHLVANARKNTILAYAPPDKMAIVAQAVKLIDVPSERASLLRTMNRMQIYRLVAIDPQPLVNTLHEIGNLSHDTVLEVDTKNKAIIAFATPADHLTIRRLVDKLDGSGRQFHVIPLRRHDAAQVAGTIEFMMGAGEQKQQSSSGYYGYIYGRGRNQPKAEDDRNKFRVDADLENNRLILRANEVEMAEIESLLVKLGEIPPRGGRADKVRVIDVAPGRQTDALLRRLQRHWKQIAPDAGPLILDLPEEKARQPDEQTKRQRDLDNTSAQPRPASRLLQFAQLRQLEVKEFGEQAERAGAAAGEDPLDAALDALRQEQADERPPITIRRRYDGQLVIASDDTEALDRLEELMMSEIPPRQDYKVFYLKHASAFWVAMNLEEVFEEEEKDDSLTRRWRPWWGPMPGSKQKGLRMSRRRPLKFVDDTDSNSILVLGADPSQLKQIEELIDIYDRPEPMDTESARFTKTVAIRYSKAQIVADAVKEVYRDLLSERDKALAQQQGQQQRQRPRSMNTYIMNYGDSGASNSRTRVAFRGKLSIGIDALSNTLLISTEGKALMRNVQDLITSLDEAAKPATTFQVVKIGPGVSAQMLERTLSKLMVEGQARPTPSQQPQQQPNGGERRSNGGRRSNGRGR